MEAKNLDYEVGTKVGVLLQRNLDRVRAPDVFVKAHGHLPDGELPDAFLEIAPDLTVEVVSPQARAPEVQEKVEEWLRGGARLDRVCHPNTGTVYTYRRLSEVRVYRASGVPCRARVAGSAVVVERLFP